jgi:hypothetical protein
MTTSDCTIDQLLPYYVSQIRDTREATERVIRYSKARSPSLSDLFNIFRGVITISIKWQRLTDRQCEILQRLTAFDFINSGQDELLGVVEAIDMAVTNGRDLLSDVNTLGSEIRIWWQRPMLKFAEQVEHLDSIAESLRIECDPEASLLLASAVSSIGDGH